MIAARCLAFKAPLGMMLRAGVSSLHRRKLTTALSSKITTDRLTPRTRAENYTNTSGDYTNTHGDYTTAHQHPINNSSTECKQELDVPLLVSVLRQENAIDICVIKVPPELQYTEHLIIVSGASPRHLSAMSAFLIKVFKFLRKDGERHVFLEGSNCDDWKCIDFGSVVVHLMLPETRETFELEKLWTLRSYDQQLRSIPDETLPLDFIYDIRDTT